MKTERKHAMGEGGYCICPKCEKKMAHQQGIPCQDLKCPDCAVKMLREGSYHHDLFVMKRKKNTEGR
jgi:hypothetical protein